MKNRRTAFTVGGAVLGLVLMTASANAGLTASRTTYVTFNRPVSLPGRTLSVGTYIFELASPDMNLDLVRVISRDRSKVLFMGRTVEVSRPGLMPNDRQLSFAEAPAERPLPIIAWYPIGDSIGHKFIYEK